MDFIEMIRSRQQEEEQHPIPAMAHELLREFQKRYELFQSGQNPFCVGDLVTPRPDGSLKSAGEPHIVIDTRAITDPKFTGNDGSPMDGERHDMRVGKFVRSQICTYWVESCEFEPWVPKD